MVFVFPVLMLLSALALSGLAAYISILGLMQIFPGSVVEIASYPVNLIAAIAIAMEAAKVILAGALHLYWKRFLTWMKILFTAQIVVLMIITAIGVFGFLSKSHLNAMMNIGGPKTEVAKIDVQIKSENDKIETLAAQRKALDDNLAEASKGGFVSAAAKARKTLQPDYDRVDKETQLSRIRLEELGALREEKMHKVNEVLVEVGPLIYFAKLIWGQEDESTIGKAVRTLILMLMFVFDPLAVALVVAAMLILSWHYDKRLKKREKERSLIKGTKKFETSPKVEKTKATKPVKPKITTPVQAEVTPPAPPTPTPPKAARKREVGKRVPILSTTDGMNFTTESAAISLKPPMLRK